MIRRKIRQLAENDRPDWLVNRIPDGVWNWAFGVTPDEALVQKALAELQARPSITVYDFQDGQEFNRRSANPFGELRRSMESVAEQLTKMGEALNNMFAGLRVAAHDSLT